MARIRFGVRQQIFTGFFVVIVIFVINVGFTIYFNQRNNSIAVKNTEVVNPSKEALDKFRAMVLNSEKLITNWVYLQSNEEDKSELVNLHNQKYPALKEELNKLKKKWKNYEQQKELDSIFKNFDNLLKEQKTIMEDLVSFEDYEDPVKKFTNQDNLETKILPTTKVLRKQLEFLSEKKNQEVIDSQKAQIESFEIMDRLVWILFIIVLTVGLIAAYVTANRITTPLKILQNTILKLGRGELPDRTQFVFGKDEIGEMANAVEKLVTGIKDTSNFAEKIGKGELDAEYAALSENDVLGNSLLSMRKNLQEVAKEDRRRNWATEGIAKFSDILRGDNSEIDKLSYLIIKELVLYTVSNQGALYILNDSDNEEEPYLSNAATYAWDREKFIEQKIYIGDGLVGQAWQDKDTLNITEVPDNFIHIGSGTGQAKPRAILIVPLIVNEQVFGCIELASFKPYENYKIEFVKKVGESIAATLNTVKINEKTNKLLAESRELTEQMRAQEEEMRQNMEELMATQEEMERKSMEMEEALKTAEEQQQEWLTQKANLEKQIIELQKN